MYKSYLHAAASVISMFLLTHLHHSNKPKAFTLASLRTSCNLVEVLWVKTNLIPQSCVWVCSDWNSREDLFTQCSWIPQTLYNWTVKEDILIMAIVLYCNRLIQKDALIKGRGLWTIFVYRMSCLSLYVLFYCMISALTQCFKIKIAPTVFLLKFFPAVVCLLLFCPVGGVYSSCQERLFPRKTVSEKGLNFSIFSSLSYQVDNSYGCNSV